MKSPSPRIVASLALLGAIGFAFWLWLGPGTEGGWSDGRRAVDADVSLRIASWGAPAPAFSGEPPQLDSRAALSSDGRWLVFAGKDESGGHDLFVGEVSEGRVESFAPLEALCSAADECAPAFGGEWLYFSSDREGGVGGHDLWRAQFADGIAAAPELVPGPANTPGEELDPAPCLDSASVVFASDREGSWDLYSSPLEVAEGAVTTRLDRLCSAADEREPAFTQDDRALVFSSSRGGGQGGFDLYRAARFGAAFASPHALTQLNSAEDERSPLATSDQLALSFLRSEAGENPILLSAPAIELFRSPPRAITWMEWLALAGLLALAALALLVQRFPELDRIYKCLLLSVIAHLLLLWWFHDLWLPATDQAPEPSHAPLHIRLEERTPAPARESEPVAASAPAPEPAPASAAEPAPEMSLPVAASEPASSAAPERLELRAPASEPEPSAASVASVAPETHARREREESAVEPAAAAERAVALRESSTEATGATPAPALEIESLADGAPSATSRSMGMPSRPDERRSLGSPAASPSSGSVARAAPPSAASSAPSSSARDAQPAARSLASELSELRDASRAGLESTARAAAPASKLELGELAVGERPDATEEAAESAPQRADLPRNQPSNQSSSSPATESVARRASEIAPSGPAPRAPSNFAPDAPSVSRGTDLAALAPPSPAEVAGRAEQAPALGLRSLEPQSAPRATNPASAGPQRAAGVEGSSRPSPASEPRGESLASRAAPPELGLPRAPDALGNRGPIRSERPVALSDAPDSVARPAAPAGSSAEPGWLPGLAQAPAAERSGAPASPAPERAQTARAAQAAAPLAENAPSLARAPEPPREDQPRPAKSDWDSTPYQNRSGAEKARALKLYGGSEETEAAVERGLKYLASIQHPNGSWGNLEVLDEKYGRVAIGKTALCTLAFLGAGHTPDSATQHSQVVARALEFLLSVQDPESGHFGQASAYDHGIATYAIGESFALTHAPRLRAALERAIAHVLAMQSRRDDDRYRGGWGYYFADGSQYDQWPRTSITAWQVMALESARLSGLAVPDSAFDQARSFLDHAQDEELGGAYRYNHDPERLGSAWPTLPASTPAALFALALLGEDIADEEHASARQYVLDRAPDGYRYSGENDFVRLGRGNPYFWYYGTLAMFRLGGNDWQRWNAALQESLLPAQARDGSWKPLDVYARYARDDDGDKSYTSALCVLSLEVYYRYYLPLLKVR
ncbi:MAG TPA: hypothetical protein VK843_01965 [Planctomycetota bacterium]|nr:hypothetical protein [Planctomycetota bacterium]